jgi:hypothetical protein
MRACRYGSGRPDLPLASTDTADVPVYDRPSPDAHTRGEAKLLGLLEAGDPQGEVRLAWHAKETIRGIYDIDDRPRPTPSLPSSQTTSSTVTTRPRSAR